MKPFEASSAFGRLDKTFLGMWLNVDAATHLDQPQRSLPLFLSSFYLPINDDHREFVMEQESGSKRGLAAAAFTAAAHESRHFHDLLFTCYGSVLARQHTRAALLLRASFDDLLLRSRMIIVPLDAWSDYWQTLRILDERVEPPSATLAELGQQFATMRIKLEAFNRSTLLPNFPMTATDILEAIAGSVQGRLVHLEFGDGARRDFLDLMRETGAFGRYFSVIEWLVKALGPMPLEAALLLLEASLCGDFQDPREDVARYPVDLLITMVDWLHRQGIAPGELASLDEVYNRVNDFFQWHSQSARRASRIG